MTERMVKIEECDVFLPAHLRSARQAGREAGERIMAELLASISRRERRARLRALRASGVTEVPG